MRTICDIMSSRSKHTLNWIVISCLLLGTACYIYAWFGERKIYTTQQIARMFDPVTSKYGIEIVYEVGPDFFSPFADPGLPAGPAQDSMVLPMAHWVLKRYPHILQESLNKYPAKVIEENLKAIHLAKEIDEDGFKYGGSYDPFRGIIYLANNGSQSDISSIATFHHEFSSLLLSHHSFLLNPWLDCNPNGFRYFYDDNTVTTESLGKKHKYMRNGSDGDYEKGFMNIYGQTNFENDFNEYAAMIFTYPEKFKKIMRQYPRVRAKFLLWLDFYRLIDPVFTEEYLLGG